MINLEFNEEVYQDYLSKHREYPTCTRIRPEDMSFVDAAIEGQEIMQLTRNGRETLEYISRIGE
jgi:hypothetical protein